MGLVRTWASGHPCCINSVLECCPSWVQLSGHVRACSRMECSDTHNYGYSCYNNDNNNNNNDNHHHHNDNNDEMMIMMIIVIIVFIVIIMFITIIITVNTRFQFDD